MRARGFTLVELMVALVAGLLVSIAVVAFLMSSFRSNSQYIQSTRLTQELRNSLDIVTRDLRRAGYDENALAKLATGQASKFSRIKLDLEISPNTTPKTYECVIYGYDRPDQGACGLTPPAGGTIDTCNGEVRGIRRKQVTINGASIGVLEYAVSEGSTKPDCAGASPDYSAFPATCNATSKWCLLSDPSRLDISQFALTDRRFTLGSGTSQVQMRNLDVNLAGRVAGNTEYTRGVRSNVRIRSECYDALISNCSNVPAN
jgi:type II secretory pathway component PulJ